MDVCAVPAAVLAPIVGRDGELARLCGLAGRERLVTVTGPGGCGKTRLVVEAAAGWNLHGVAELSGVRGDPATAVLAACGFREDPARPAVDVLAERLGREPGVLVLDGCEHVADAVAALVTDLAGRCAPLRVVATSRVALDVPGEVVLPLEGLDPDRDGVDLFLDRARRVRPQLPDDADARATAARICRMADGLPLGVELAAAHARSLPLTAIRDGMADRSHFLTVRNGATGRDGALPSALDWCAERVGAPARAALRALSLFDGRFGLDAALAATGDHEALQTLVEHSLVRFDAADDRYLLLDTVRAYASADPDPNERRSVLDGLLTWATWFARDVRVGLEHADPDALSRVDRADAAISSVLDRACESGQGLDAAAAVVEDMAFGWSLRGRCAGGLARARALAAALDDVPPGLEWAHGFLAFHAGDLTAGTACAERAVRAGGPRVRARALILLGAAQTVVDPSGAEHLLAEAAGVAGGAGDDWALVEAARCRADTHLYRGAPADALRCVDDVAHALDRIRHPQLRAWDAAVRADAVEAGGRYADALREGRRGIALARAVGEPVAATRAWLPLLRALVALGHDAEAARVRDDGLRFVDDHPGPGCAPAGLLGTALVASRGPVEAAVDAARAATACPDLVPAGVAEAGVLLAVALLRSGDPGAAHDAAVDAAATAQAIGHRGLVVSADLVTAAAAAADGREASAAAFDVLGTAHELGLRLRVADALDLVASIHRAGDRSTVAARLHAAAARIRTDLAVVPGPLAGTLLPPPGWADDPAVALALAEGERFGEAGAVGYARRARGRRGRPRAGWESLTPTEREVVALVATGRSNAEIAAMLLVSPGTVRTHLRSVFAKLGVTSRTALAAQAAAVGA